LSSSVSGLLIEMGLRMGMELGMGLRKLQIISQQKDAELNAMN